VENILTNKFSAKNFKFILQRRLCLHSILEMHSIPKENCFLKEDTEWLVVAQNFPLWILAGEILRYIHIS